jgi:sulfate/thiosulfate transport system permease protein
MTGKYLVRYGVLGYLALILLAPLGLVGYRTFEHGWDPFWRAISNPEAVHALKLTLEIAIVAVPLNTIFGVLCALAIVRHRMPAMGLVNALVDLPLALSPVVVGLALVLLYGNGGWFDWLPFDVLFAYPSMLLATIFVSLPFVVREVVPVLREIGTDPEEAAATLGASTLQTFRRITLPAIRWAVAYGVVLTMARALGEFGAVSVVSGRISGQTETLTLRVEAAYENFDTTGAYAISMLLAALAIVTLLLMTLLRPKDEIRGD